MGLISLIIMKFMSVWWEHSVQYQHRQHHIKHGWLKSSTEIIVHMRLTPPKYHLIVVLLFGMFINTGNVD